MTETPIKSGITLKGFLSSKIIPIYFVTLALGFMNHTTKKLPFPSLYANFYLLNEL
jgi:hypothetical protein